MLRRSIILTAFLAIALLLVQASLAARVHVRVEGKTQTIYGSTQPLLEGGANALTALDSASILGEFYVHVQTASFGSYVDQIGRYPAAGTSGWVFKLNGVSPPVGADAVVLKDGDTVLWYWATFGIVPGGPPTLVLQRQPRNCYRVLAQGDDGATRPAAGAVLRAGSRSFRTTGGRACIGRHTGLVRATLAGAIRSNSVR